MTTLLLNRQLVLKQYSAFQRYNLVTEEEMKSIKWLDEKGEKFGTIDTYMDTIAKTKIV